MLWCAELLLKQYSAVTTFIMGVDSVAYRSRIGRFNVRKTKTRSIAEQTSISIMNIIFSAAVIAILLIVGNIEINPGPNTNDNETGLKTIENTLAQLVTAISDLTKENKITNDIIRQNKLDIIEMKKEILLTKKEIKRQDYTGRINNLVMYGVEERGYERNIILSI